MSSRVQSMLPVHDAEARVLILGTMPGRRSLTAQQYYADPGNLFWPFMGAILGFNPAVPYPARCQHLLAHGIALWDVAAECLREGSSDAGLSEVRPNGLRDFIGAHPRLLAIGFNGKKAEELFRGFFSHPAPAIRRVTLYSTSGANAGVPRDRKASQWRDFLTPLILTFL